MSEPATHDTPGDGFLRHEACPACGSSDANAVYDDGHTHCFSCNAHMSPAGSPSTAPKRAKGFSPIEGRPQALNRRRISEDTCRKFRYHIGHDRAGNAVQLANYYDTAGNHVAQHVRKHPKDFSWLGEAKKACLFGQHLWAGGGRRLVITEGEIDALSVAETMPGWPVVSIPNGARSARRALKPHLEWLESFGEVVLCFDSDEPGRQAANEAAELFSPGKCKIVTLPLKDASDMWMARRADDLRKAILFNAKVYRPDGIVSGQDDKVKDYVVNFTPRADAHYPWPVFDRKLYGMRKGELVTHTAGTGIGKSTVCREIAFDLGVNQGQKVGIIALEESVGRYGLQLASIAANQRLHLRQTEVSQEDRLRYFDTSVGNGNFFLYDHWGSMDAANLLSRLRYLVRGCGCQWLILDHLSIVVSGLADEDERKTLDKLMTDLRSLVEETGCGLHIISHLSRRTDGKAHEEGAPIRLRDLRGSHSIVQLSDVVLGYERNQQCEEKATLEIVRCLKNRYSGETGTVTQLEYNMDTGRLMEVEGDDAGALGFEAEDKAADY